MARKRTYGTGCLFLKEKGWAIRWRAPEFGPNGRTQQGQFYEFLGPMSRREAMDVLAQRVATAGNGKVDMTLNVYTQVMDGATRAAANRVGAELFGK